MGDERQVAIREDGDIVTARQAGREVAAELGFSLTDQTVIATAISEVARNILEHASSGEVRIAELRERKRHGIVIVARDDGPGIPDVGRALQDGFTTGRGLGMGLPGAKRLMDELAVESTVGRGTTVRMVKWRSADA